MTTPRDLHKYGTILLWIGVLAWAPYFGLRIAGQNPSLLAFLPFHLGPVIGGARMRAAARQKLGLAKEKRAGYKRAGYGLIIAGVLAWVPYFALKLTGRPADLNLFLPIHLTGVLGGLASMVIGGMVERSRSKSE